MTSYLTSIDIFSLSRTVFEKIRVKILISGQPAPVPYRGLIRNPTGPAYKEQAQLDIQLILQWNIQLVPARKQVPVGSGTRWLIWK